MTRWGPGRSDPRDPNRFVEWYESARFAPLIIVLAIGGAVALAFITGIPGTAILPIWLAVASVVFISRFTSNASATSSAVEVEPPVDDGWTSALRRMRELSTEFAAYECDPLAVLRLPALADVSVPSTARFIDAFAEAQALQTDTAPPAQHAAEFGAAVDRAARAWDAAREAARRIRDSNLAPAERAVVERVIKMLTVARTSESEPERRVAYAKARSELAKLGSTLRLPVPAQAALDTAARSALPPATS